MQDAFFPARSDTTDLQQICLKTFFRKCAVFRDLFVFYSVKRVIFLKKDENSFVRKVKQR